MSIERVLSYGKKEIPLKKGVLPENLQFAKSLRDYLHGMRPEEALRMLGCALGAKEPIPARVERDYSLAYLVSLNFDQTGLECAAQCFADDYKLYLDAEKDSKAKREFAKYPKYKPRKSR